MTVFLTIGMDVKFEGDMSVEDMYNEGVRRAYTHPDNVLRASVLADPTVSANTKDNTPAIIHMKLVPGNTVDVHVAAKGGGSEAKSSLPCSTSLTLLLTGCWQRRWAQVGAHRVCWVLVLAVL